MINFVFSLPESARSMRYHSGTLTTDEVQIK